MQPPFVRRNPLFVAVLSFALTRDAKVASHGLDDPRGRARAGPGARGCGARREGRGTVHRRGGLLSVGTPVFQEPLATAPMRALPIVLLYGAMFHGGGESGAFLMSAEFPPRIQVCSTPCRSRSPSS